MAFWCYHHCVQLFLSRPTFLLHKYYTFLVSIMECPTNKSFGCCMFLWSDNWWFIFFLDQIPTAAISLNNSGPTKFHLYMSQFDPLCLLKSRLFSDVFYCLRFKEKHIFLHSKEKILQYISFFGNSGKMQKNSIIKMLVDFLNIFLWFAFLCFMSKLTVWSSLNMVNFDTNKVQNFNLHQIAALWINFWWKPSFLRG